MAGRLPVARIYSLSRTAVLVAVTLLLVGCGGQGTTAAHQTSAGTLPSPEQLTGKFDVGGYRLFLSCRGSGSPTVVFESGLNSPGNVWAAVQEHLPASVRTCWYDRAGVGMSENRPEERITSQVLADELGALLRTAGVPSPYLLVAHSIGGFTIRLVASDHPDEVVGLVLVDTTASDWPALRRDLPEGNSVLDAHESGTEVEAADVAGDRPVAVIRHGQPVEGFTRRDEIRFARAQERLVRSSGNGLEIVALESGHDVPVTQPELVAVIIRSVLAAARTPRPLECPSGLARLGGRCRT